MEIWTVPEETAGERLDKALSSEYEELSRSFLQKLIKEGAVYVNGKAVRPSRILAEGDIVGFELPEPETLKIEPQDIPLDVLYEDEDVILINKPRGMVVHPAPGHPDGTLVNALLYHCKGSLSGINGVLRPGIVHRIDRDTTGVIIACKNDNAHKSLADQLKVHSITRRYTALVRGGFKEEEGTVDAPIGRSPKDRMKMAVTEDGKRAVTHFRVLERFSGYTLIECRLETGRTHQIRVHMTYLGHPLAGDPVYGTGKDPFACAGQMLHARVFGFVHPRTGAYMEFEAPLPADFEAVLARLRRQNA